MLTFVPDIAIVPRLLTRSAFDIPIPVSRMVRILFSLSGTIRMYNSFSESKTEGSIREAYRILSRASEQLEMSSRRKISLLL